MPLRWYQNEAVEAAYSYLCSKSGNPVINLPTGSGKSWVIAELARRAVEDFGGRVLVVQHRKELIDQNADKVRQLVSIPVGRYSAGLRRFQTAEDIVLCGIQSVYDKATLFDSRQLVLVDEVHLVPTEGEGMYKTFLNDMRTINPNIRCIGLTATPFRTGEGALCRPDGMFQEVCYSAPIKRLIDEGHLCRVTNSPTIAGVDTSRLHMRYGEFIAKEVEGLFGGMATIEACREIIAQTQDRHSVMVFCSSVIHAETVVDTLRQFECGRVEMVEGGTLPLERETILKDFVSQRVRFLVNVDVLTTGFDAPCVDAIAILRATASAGLFAQIVGRGLRTHESKTECRVLDFGENIKRHGPIDAIDYGKPKARSGEKTPTDGKVKECPNCSMVIPAHKWLCECGFRFTERTPNHQTEADTQTQIISEPELFSVEGVYYSRHEKEGKTPSLRVDYKIASDGNLDKGISEWVCLEHTGFARTKAEKWWGVRCIEPLPDNVDDALDLCQRGLVACPKSITATREGRFWRVLEAEIEEIPTVETIEDEVPF